MERNEHIAKGLQAFAAKEYRQALGHFTEAIAGGPLPEEILFELGTCTVHCASDQREKREGIALLEQVQPASDQYLAARLTIRQSLAELDDTLETVRERVRNECALLTHCPDEDCRSAAVLVLAEGAGRLRGRGETLTSLDEELATLCEPLFAAFALRWVDGAIEDAAAQAGRVTGVLAPIARLWQARFLVSAGRLEAAVELYETILRDHSRDFARALVGWPKEILAEADELAARKRQDDTAAMAGRDQQRGQSLFDAGRFQDALTAWEESLGDGYSRRTLLRMAATAWHRLGDDDRAFAYLAQLQGRDRSAAEARLLERAIHVGLVERVKKFVRLGLRRAAFDELVKVRALPSCDERTRLELDELLAESLCSPWLRLLRERLRQNAGLSFRMQEKDSPIWKLLRQARGRIEGEEKDDDEPMFDDPSLLPRMQKEMALLRWLEELILERERRVPDVFSTDQFIALLEDRSGLEAFEQLLARVDPVVEAFAEYSDGTHLEVKDFIGSFLPNSIRDKVCDEGYLDVVRLENELERDVKRFLKTRYVGITF